MKKPKYVSPLKKRRKKCDDLFGKFIKERDKQCVNPLCKHVSTIKDWSHWIPRSRLATRWLEDNCYCLCRSCHIFFDGNSLGQLQYDALVLSLVGEVKYFALKELARTSIKEREAVELCESFLRERGYLV